MKVAVGLSGGVDSSLSAALLVAAGHDVVGVYLECWRAPGCRAEDDRKDALQVALDLGIPFRSLDFREAYRQRVVERFFHDYELGLTPNPDVWCNTEVKFGLFYEWAMAQGFDAVATGHYAQVMTTDKDHPAAYTLQRSVDEKKDQSYFLYRTRQEQLPHILFPIGHLPKAEVRAQALARHLLTAAKPDSQGICFIGDIDVHNFLRERLGEKPGQVLDVEGNVIGNHEGHWFYTIGQRHGFTLLPKIYTKNAEWKHVLPPLYVIAKNADDNTITVGYGAETLTGRVELIDVFWRKADLAPVSVDPQPIIVRLRHGGALLPATISHAASPSQDAWQVTLTEPQRGIAPGQAMVFYDAATSQICLGGGVVKA
jgi:tRNA-specific 2-thiouridylase